MFVSGLKPTTMFEELTLLILKVNLWESAGRIIVSKPGLINTSTDGISMMFSGSPITRLSDFHELHVNGMNRVGTVAINLWGGKCGIVESSPNPE